MEYRGICQNVDTIDKTQAFLCHYKCFFTVSERTEQKKTMLLCFGVLYQRSSVLCAGVSSRVRLSSSSTHTGGYLARDLRKHEDSDMFPRYQSIYPLSHKRLSGRTSQICCAKRSEDAPYSIFFPENATLFFIPST